MRQQPRPIIGSLYVLLLVSAAAGSAAAGSIIGTAIYRERVLLPPEAVFEAGIEEVSRADGPSGVIATTRIGSPQVPLAFTLGHDDARISNDRRYVIRARITLNGNIFFTTDTAYPVLGIAGGNHVDILLRRTGDTSAAPLENTYWKLTVLRGASVETVDPQHEAHLILDPKEQRVSGSSGCNRLIGAYTLTGDRLSFGQMAGTMMACPKGMEQEQAFLQTLPSVTSWRVAGQHLDLLDGHGTVVAQLEAGAMP